MFEQSLLPNPAVTGKKWSMLASVTAQTSVVAILLMAPLIYTDRLSFIAPPPAIPITAPKPLEPVERQQTPATGPTNALTPIRIFQPPSRQAAIFNPVQTQWSDAPQIAAPPGVAQTIGDPLGRVLNFPTVTPIPRVPQPAAKPAPAPEAAPHRVSSGVQEAKLVNRVVPTYPRIAITTRVSGVVKLEAIIAKDGGIKELKVISGHPFLIQAALEAVRQWIYKPTLLSGEPVEVITSIEVNFKLGGDR